METFFNNESMIMNFNLLNVLEGLGGHAKDERCGQCRNREIRGNPLNYEENQTLVSFSHNISKLGYLKKEQFQVGYIKKIPFQVGCERPCGNPIYTYTSSFSHFFRPPLSSMK